MNILNKIFKPQKEVPVPKDIEYFIGDSKIILHSGHALPKYQKEHRLYDRFLPILAKHLPKEKIIVDPGIGFGKNQPERWRDCFRSSGWLFWRVHRHQSDL